MFRQYGALNDCDEETSLFTEDNLTHFGHSADESLPSHDYRTERQMRYTFNHWSDRLWNNIAHILISCKSSFLMTYHNVDCDAVKIYPPSKNVLIGLALLVFVIGMFFLVTFKGTGIAEWMNGWIMYWTHPAIK